MKKSVLYFVCDDNAGFCKYDKKCSEIEDKMKNYHLYYSIFDNQAEGSMEVSVPHTDLLIPGDLLSDSADTCYFGIFKSFSNE